MPEEVIRPFEPERTNLLEEGAADVSVSSTPRSARKRRTRRAWQIVAHQALVSTPARDRRALSCDHEAAQADNP